MSVVTGRALPPVLHGANEALAFLLEIAMLAALAWWGVSQHASVAMQIMLAIAAPAITVVLWGAFAAPRARVKLPLPGVLAIKALAFGAAGSAYMRSDGTGWRLPSQQSPSLIQPSQPSTGRPAGAAPKSFSGPA